MVNLEKDIREIKSNVNSLISQRAPKGRPWLYTMAFIAMIGTLNMGSGSNQTEILNSLGKVSTKTETSKILKLLGNQTLQVKNIAGDTIPENYYVLGNDTAIVSYDGKPILDYLQDN